MKRLLAIDGGGIRGVLALEILREIETKVRLRHGLALHEYFDLIAGTSTGAIIATYLRPAAVRRPRAFPGTRAIHPEPAEIAHETRN